MLPITGTKVFFAAFLHRVRLRAAGRGEIGEGSTVLINLSGRGDKDVAQVREILAGRA